MSVTFIISTRLPSVMMATVVRFVSETDRHQNVLLFSMKLKLISPKDLTWPLLFKASEPVTDVKTQVVPHLRNMRELMEGAGGAGLAACQVSVFFRFFIYGGRWLGNPELVLTVINPSLNFPNPAKEIANEGCLSFPGLHKPVERYKEVELTYTDLAGNSKTIELDGMIARVIQHEVDHTNGLCIFDSNSGMAS